ncbi:molybdopterin-dependent oxidoreductase [Paenarthrobacter sp. Z7-10]|uniref:molybdopterin-dependent oxidoreductase n=1 Tax=Paenarthrobacter sp. Z7-10 TaxID=2787635 RepID=UPI0022A98B4E|nr:molybdopterin-dependent oxidoreductase [Paenarthrobacter sp. Z7-10]
MFWAAVCGLISVAIGVVAGELTAAAISPAVSPLTGVGGAAIDGMPPGVKDWAISIFGTSDKLAFLIAMCLVVAVLAALAGIFEVRRRFVGVVGIAVFGIVGLVAVLTRAQSTTAAIAAPVLAAVLAILLLGAFRKRLLAWLPRNPDPTRAPAAGEDRRRFLQAAGAGAGVAVVAGIFAAVARTTAVGVAQAREKLRLPAPASPSTTPGAVIPAGAEIKLDGMEPLVTPNADFYRIDTALVVPNVNPTSWKLTVTGMVDHEVEIDLATLLAKPMMEQYVTIACVSNEVGGDLIGNAKWLGWPVRELLALAGVKPGADMVLSSSTDGFTAGTPLEAMTDNRGAMIAVGMNDALLPIEHGFPARLIVPGLYGFVSATKWVTNLKVTTFAEDLGYWSTRGWSTHGIIKTSSRIDTPRDGGSVKAGSVPVGGVAWAQERGISKVEVRVDQGNWQEAKLAPGISKDTWYQWSAQVQMDPGGHQLQVRATDGQGQLQTDQVAPPAPDGASGFHTIHVQAG